MADPDFPDDFLNQARQVALGVIPNFEIDPAELSRIAGDPVMRTQFQRMLERENDPQLKKLIEQFIADLALGYDDQARGEDRKVDLFDRAGMTIAGSIAATGVGTTIAAVVAAGTKGAAIGSMLGPIGALGGGLAAIVIVSFGRHTLKKRADKSRSLADRLRRLI